MEKSQKAEVCSNDDILMGRHSEDPLLAVVEVS